MTKIKLCGLSRPEDILTANTLMPEYIGFVFAPASRRYIPPTQAASLKALLSPHIQAVGVFVNEQPETIADLMKTGIIDIAQLHGREDNAKIRELKTLTSKPVIKAFSIRSLSDIEMAQNSEADYVLLDSGSGGTGAAFNWNLLKSLHRPYFLAGGLNSGNVKAVVEAFSPYGVDVSSGIETNGKKDKQKMNDFVCEVRSPKGKDQTI